MKKLLYIGHAYHNKTKSSQFLKNMMSERYNITQFDYDPESDNFDKFQQLDGQSFDIVVLFQIMPPMHKLKKYVKCDKIVFFPMFDGSPDIKHPIWSEYKDCIIINFSKTLHKRCKHVGLASFYIQYFPKPCEILNMGEEKKVFLWQRTNQVTINTVEKTFGENNIEQLYLHNEPNIGYKFEKPFGKWKEKSIVSTWFDTKEQMNEYLQECAIYYAPRSYEGIGMSFLDAMAVGRCIIAPDHPTMNEYITNGVNGYLYNYENPRRIKIKNLRKIQQNTIKFIQDGYKKWERNKYKILDWLEADPKKHSNAIRQDTRLYVCEHKKKKIKISITFAIKKTTEKWIIYYLFGFLPIYLKIRKVK